MPESIQTPPTIRAPSCRMITLIHAPSENRAPSDRRERHGALPEPERERQAEGARAAGLAEPQRDHRHVRDREREHRAEREDARQELHVVRQRQAEGDQRRRDDDHVGSAAARVEAAQRARDLTVGRERVREPREPEHLPVHRHDQGGRADRAHRVGGRFPEPFRVERRRHAQHRRLLERGAQGGLPALHRYRHQRGGGHPHEQDHRRDRADDDESPQALAADAHLAG